MFFNTALKIMDFVGKNIKVFSGTTGLGFTNCGLRVGLLLVELVPPLPWVGPVLDVTFPRYPIFSSDLSTW